MTKVPSCVRVGPTTSTDVILLETSLWRDARKKRSMSFSMPSFILARTGSLPRVTTLSIVMYSQSSAIRSPTSSASANVASRASTERARISANLPGAGGISLALACAALSASRSLESRLGSAFLMASSLAPTSSGVMAVWRAARSAEACRMLSPSFFAVSARSRWRVSPIARLNLNGVTRRGRGAADAAKYSAPSALAPEG
mmetsp:Transcript_26844/g.91643  ORF Transcript_26844/g.91643 Transcript_26844/m.91643 type:complete len:201 (-) Transcript_26844:350-952(-)